MRVLHIVKTSQGAVWAAREAAELVRQGVEVHAVLPTLTGAAIPEWTRSGARLHACPLDLPARAPWKLAGACRDARRLVARINPDLIHTHFVGNTLLLRLALGKNSGIPRVFQVPGPLHLEHRPFRALDLATAGPRDFWIGTSQYIVDAYARAGAPAGRVFLSYHGGSASDPPVARGGALRRRLGIAGHEYVAGNANYMYPPRAYLGQKTGIKCHEQVIDAIRIVQEKRSAVVGVLIGGIFGDGHWYEERLRDRARAASARIHMPGYMTGGEIAASWADFDCAVHIPLSENCGGVLEPLLAAVPTIAARVGGLPELVRDGITGKTVAGSDPVELAAAILDVLDRLDEYRALAANGRTLVRAMFDVRRTAAEVLGVYRHILNSACPPPDPFDAAALLDRIACSSPISQ
jgi:glycosyltransferase involved in cell wall biosynthesis